MKAALYIIGLAAIASLIIIMSRGGLFNTDNVSSAPLNNVSIIDGKQIIKINARGGYSPRISAAKAGLPTVVRFNTNGSFDCSSSVRIPSLNIFQLLPQTGTTDIALGTPQAGKLLGSCGMGMYRFEIDFSS